MRATSFHNSLANLLQSTIDEQGADASDEQLVKLLLGKTRALLQKLKSIAADAEDEKLTRETLANNEQLPSDLKPFLWEFSIAENLANS